MSAAAVRQRETLSHMHWTKRPLAHSSTKLGLDQLARVSEWAARETEGNISLMVRKLLDEAIEARDTAEQEAR